MSPANATTGPNGPIRSTHPITAQPAADEALDLLVEFGAVKAIRLVHSLKDAEMGVAGAWGYWVSVELEIHRLMKVVA